MIAAACVICLKREPRYHVAQSGTAVWSGWGIAGEQALSVVAFKAMADELNGAGLGEGDSFTVHGTLQLEEWTKNGETRHGLKLIANKVDVLRSPARKRRSDGQRSHQGAQPTDGVPFDDPLPF